MKSVYDLFRPGWASHIGHGLLTAGLDVGTTMKGKSNPSALAVLERIAPTYVCRFALAWKTNDPRVTRAIIRSVLNLGDGRKVRRLAIDATSERFFAADLAREFAGQTIVDLVVSSETTTYKGEDMTFKTYLGNLLANAFENAEILVPDEDWVRRHLRQPYREKGGFECDVDEQGNHGDLFDALKLALHAQKRGAGQVEAEPIGPGSFDRVQKREGAFERLIGRFFPQHSVNP